MKLSPLKETTPPLCLLELEKTSVDGLEEVFLGVPTVALHCLLPLVVFTSCPTNVDLEELSLKLTPPFELEALFFPPCSCVRIMVEFDAAVHTLFFETLACFFFAEKERRWLACELLNRWLTGVCRLRYDNLL